MKGNELHNLAKNIASNLNGTYEDFPFGPEHCVYRVENKIFIFISYLKGKNIITIKTDPEKGMINREIFNGIKVGYHMNKKHWITLYPESDVHKELVEDLIKDSYRLVVSKLPKNKRTALLKD